MSEALWMTCHRDPKWAANEIATLRQEVETLRIYGNAATKMGVKKGPTMRFATHCPDGQLCGTSATTGCLEGQCQRDPRLSQPKCHSCGGFVKLEEGGICLPCHTETR